MSGFWSVMLGLVPLAAAPPAAGPVEAEVVVRGVLLVDGTGSPAVVGDLAWQGDRIVAVGRFPVAGRPREIDGRGLVASPGFIDLHTHSDFPLLNSRTRGNLSYLFQGVTTAVTGNCGAGPANVAGFYRDLEKGKVGSNVLHQVPHNAVRTAVMKNADRAPTEAELQKMEDLVAQGMRDGAWGLSTGLIYTPGTYARTEELIALARVSARHGGFYASHIRDEGTGVLVAVEEALRIGREARLPVHISHIKVTGRSMWGRGSDVIAAIEKARKDGQRVTADQYPYPASSTSLAAIVIPTRFRAGEQAEFLARLKDPDLGPVIRQAIEDNLGGRNGGDTLRVARYTPKPGWQGKDLATIAREEKRSAVEIVLEIEQKGGAQMVSFGMHEEDVRLFMRRDWVATASDGASMVPAADTVPHPRSYGTFPRKIGRYALAEKVISLEHAIRSASGLPADILGLERRGYLKPGYFADVVVFDPARFRDLATFDKPHQYAAGVKYLWVNGVAAIEEGKATGALTGRVLRKPATRGR
jgi:N-acyl-D-aspartate/D-glutamate deacylase